MRFITYLHGLLVSLQISLEISLVCPIDLDRVIVRRQRQYFPTTVKLDFVRRVWSRVDLQDILRVRARRSKACSSSLRTCVQGVGLPCWTNLLCLQPQPLACPHNITTYLIGHLPRHSATPKRFTTFVSSRSFSSTLTTILLNNHDAPYATYSSTLSKQSIRKVADTIDTTDHSCRN